MAKQTYFCPEIPTITRTTDRTYTHVVVSSNGSPLTWCGRPDLALTQVAYYSKHATGVRMLPVEIQPKPEKTKKK